MARQIPTACHYPDGAHHPEPDNLLRPHGGNERWLMIHLDNLKPPNTFVQQVLAALPDKLRLGGDGRQYVTFFGEALGFIVKYSPDKALRCSLSGEPLRILPKAYRPGKSAMDRVPAHFANRRGSLARSRLRTPTVLSCRSPALFKGARSSICTTSTEALATIPSSDDRLTGSTVSIRRGLSPTPTTRGAARCSSPLLGKEAPG